jgi:hypothetical protein
MDLLTTAFGFVLGILVPHWLLLWDERRLSSEARNRAWNDASHWAAIVAFSFLCVPVHFAKTRRSAWGLLSGVFWMVLTAIGTTLVLKGVSLVVDALAQW